MLAPLSNKKPIASSLPLAAAAVNAVSRPGPRAFMSAPASIRTEIISVLPPGDHHSGVDRGDCHANDFEPGPHKKYENPDTRYTVGELRDCTGAGHVYTDSTLTRIKNRRNGPEHRPSRREF